MKRTTWRTRLIGLVIVLSLCLGYGIYDNQRFIVVEQEILIPRLPQSFDGFRILQISDLHGRTFGKRQVNLIQAINRLDYDMIAFTGDMNASTASDDSIENTAAILNLLDGLSNKEYLFWIDGNTGPHAVEDFAGAMTGEMTEIGSILKEKGVIGLTLPYAIQRGDERIWITLEMSEPDFDVRYRMLTGEEPYLGGKGNYARVQSYYAKAYAAYQSIRGSDEVKIMLSHAPKQTNLSAEELVPIRGTELDYDLILAGHYHGGQMRLPLLGALYIPSPTSGINNSGFFPAQTEVKGLNYYGEVPQYVSAGLGASGHVWWASFRLFNPPEINLITLRRK